MQCAGNISPISVVRAGLVHVLSKFMNCLYLRVYKLFSKRDARLFFVILWQLILFCFVLFSFRKYVRVYLNCAFWCTFFFFMRLSFNVGLWFCKKLCGCISSCTYRVKSCWVCMVPDGYRVTILCNIFCWHTFVLLKVVPYSILPLSAYDGLKCVSRIKGSWFYCNIM